MKRALAATTLALMAACGTGGDPDSIDVGAPSLPTEPIPSPSTTGAVPAPASSLAGTPLTEATHATASTQATVPAPAGPWATRSDPEPDRAAAAMEVVTKPGTYIAAELAIHLAFDSLVDDVTTEQFTSEAMEILTAPDGWSRSGFLFVVDTTSELRVVLAEGDVVDELCLPLKTHGTVNCQNGPVVAINADRWRRGGRDWDSTLASYRTYVVNHEVGHLIGLRHPLERCPTAAGISAVMEPQTNNLGQCSGNGVPLDWEIDWARERHAVVAPSPDWDGPRPVWPTS